MHVSALRLVVQSSSTSLAPVPEPGDRGDLPDLDRLVAQAKELYHKALAPPGRLAAGGSSDHDG